MKASSRPSVALSANTSWYLWNFRRGIIESLISQGHHVICIAPRDDKSHELEKLGCKFIDLDMDRKGTNLRSEIVLVYRFFQTFRAHRPGCVLLFTVKPVIYGSLTAKLLGISCIGTVTGLGTAFVTKSWMTILIRNLYRIPLNVCSAVFFQNRHDRDQIAPVGKKLRKNIRLVPGSGVDLTHFNNRIRFVDLPGEEAFIFLFVGRMLRDKGVYEFVEAAQKVKEHRLRAEFWLVGGIDDGNATSISIGEIQRWENQAIVRYLGKVDDVRPYLLKSNCIVLPSYREGLPRVLLEAAAMARPVIASRVPGCEDVVREGETGLLCAPQDSGDLAEKMIALFSLPEADRFEMGRKARTHVEKHYDQKSVVDQYLAAIAQ